MLNYVNNRLGSGQNLSSLPAFSDSFSCIYHVDAWQKDPRNILDNVVYQHGVPDSIEFYNGRVVLRWGW